MEEKHRAMILPWGSVAPTKNFGYIITLDFLFKHFHLNPEPTLQVLPSQNWCKQDFFTSNRCNDMYNLSAQCRRKKKMQRALKKFSLQLQREGLEVVNALFHTR
ncbi:hypothetical protein PanWU01x14_339260 [Parasponia andersonii]|uniref:Uncharacterized protein n=1 Tax=Parasponia andersonii TaxID=3476 RepID=A0A2P5AES5_PARAD|nr:hypothetical protein PanWU01x14_339260 [Parasponia andersonii]